MISIVCGSIFVLVLLRQIGHLTQADLGTVEFTYTLIREAGKDHRQNPREPAVMRRALMAPNRCEKAKAMV